MAEPKLTNQLAHFKKESIQKSWGFPDRNRAKISGYHTFWSMLNYVLIWASANMRFYASSSTRERSIIRWRVLRGDAVVLVSYVQNIMLIALT